MSTVSTPAPPPSSPHHQSFWLWVMCLTGVDYFSTLAYQPSIAFENAGMLAPLATVVLVAVTLFGALPIYCYVAGRSFNGQGSIGMLSKLVSGWYGKILILVLLGFAATDFVITKTLSAADAAEHLISNPFWPYHRTERSEQEMQGLIVTMGFLVLLGGMFLRGFREVIGLAVGIVAVFLTINALLLVFGVIYLFEHPELFELWWNRLDSGKWYLESGHSYAPGWINMILISLLLFPKLALGLSGFETGVAVMPLIRGNEEDNPKQPEGRIRNARKLLVTAALIMSVYLLTSSIVVTTLIPPHDLVTLDSEGNRFHAAPDAPKPHAADRALAYLAHGEGNQKIAPFCGDTFGTIYDLATVVILWFAGASAMAGLLNLVPQYLPKYGMAPEWARAIRPLVLLFTVINLFVTWIFDASVKAQGDAYATGVLVLISSACIATVIDRWRNTDGSWWKKLSLSYTFITAVFLYTTADIVIGKPEGIKIASFFIVTILVTSFISRIARSRELRFQGFHFVNAESRLFWDTIMHLELTVLVPHRPGRRSLASKESAIRREHRIPRDLMVIFVEVELLDASEFVQEPWLEIRKEEDRYVMRISNAASIAHTLAAVALEMAKVGRPPEIHFGWTDETPLSGTLGFLFFGEGNVPWMVRDLIRRAEPDPEKRPLIIIAGA